MEVHIFKLDFKSDKDNEYIKTRPLGHLALTVIWDIRTSKYKRGLPKIYLNFCN